MTAPVLAYKKFYIVKPKAAINYIKNPTFASPEFTAGWLAYGTYVTIGASGDGARWGVYSMKVNPTFNVLSGAYYSGLTVKADLAYTFSCYVKGVSGQAMRIQIQQLTTIKATKTFIATGYWQRVEVTYTAPVNASDYRVYVLRDPVASTEPFYVDGAQFEEGAKATTFFDGYSAGCHWTGAIRNSPSARSDNTGLGGELVDLSDYCEVVQVAGLGHGDWNQVLTEMTSGGDMYQTHIRKSRQFSIVVDFTGDTLGEIEANRAAVIDLVRPDLLSNLPVTEQFGINMPGSQRGHEQRIIRYQGFDENGVEATNPVDIVCVPLPASLVDTPDKPVPQRAVLNFAVPSGLFQGAYQEGKTLDLYADFPAEFIVKRDPQGNWCKWNGSAYQSLVTGLNGEVYCIEEGPDGKIYVGGDFTNAGGITGANYLARWNPATEAWEALGINYTGATVYTILCMAFDAYGDLYVGGGFDNLGSTSGDNIVKITNLGGSPTIQTLGIGLNNYCRAIAIDANGDVYVGGEFTSAGGVANTTYIAKWLPFYSSWAPLSTGLSDPVHTMAFAPNRNLYIGGTFTNAAYPYLCKWNGTAFSPVGTNTDINGIVRTLDVDSMGRLYVGGQFTNAGGIANADYIAMWNGSAWEALGSGVNSYVFKIVAVFGKVYVTGVFTIAGGLIVADLIAVWSNGAWQPLDIDLPASGVIESALLASDGSLYIGGNFSTAGYSENAKTGIVALNLNVASASANTYPVISITGPGTLKMITNYRTGKSVMFDGLTLQAGEWISLNFDPLNLSFRSGWAGRGNLMRYVIPGSDYGDFYLSPGENYLSLFMDNTTSATKASIVWTPKFWGLDGALL